jgi:reactive chlorine resistance protein C
MHEQSAPPSARLINTVALVLGLVLVWLGAMKFLPFEASSIAHWLSGHVLLRDLSADTAPNISGGLGVVEIALGLGVLPGMPVRLRRYAAAGLAAFFTASLSLLLTNPVWIESLGGFPAIGSGQGVIKNVAIAALAAWLWARLSMRGHAARQARRVARWGVALVLVWIGGMKFTGIEAEAIRPLIETSPWLGWLYEFLDVQQTSHLIGIVEIATAIALLALPWSGRAGAAGLAMSGLTFLATLSFLVTLPGWQEGYGAPFVGGTGQFLLKDALLLAACAVIWCEDVLAQRPARHIEPQAMKGAAAPMRNRR